jgi:hypothetical protein
MRKGVEATALSAKTPLHDTGDSTEATVAKIRGGAELFAPSLIDQSPDAVAKRYLRRQELKTTN